MVYCPDDLVLRLIVARVKPSAQSFEEHFRLPQLQGSTKTVSSDSTGNTITDTDGTNEDDIIDIASFADNGRLFLMRRSNSLKTTAATKLRVPRESERMLQETTNSCAALKRTDEKYVPKVLSSESEVLVAIGRGPCSAGTPVSGTKTNSRKPNKRLQNNMTQNRVDQPVVCMNVSRAQ